MTADPRPRNPPSPLVDFVLRHLQVRTNTCSRQRHEHGYTLEHRVNRDWNYIYVTRGRPVWIIGEVEYPLSPGWLAIIPPNVHHYGTCRTQRVTLGSIHVDATLPGGQDALALLRPPILHRFAGSPRLAAYLRGSLHEWERQSYPQTHLMLRSWARLITLELLRDLDTRGLLQSPPLDPVVAKVLAYLDESLGRDVRLDELARRAGYTPQHLNRLFRRTLGVTPLRHHAHLRMERAAALLLTESLRVKDVAEALGFRDPYYFSRAFKQHFGRSPEQQRHEGGSENPS